MSSLEKGGAILITFLFLFGIITQLFSQSIPIGSRGRVNYQGEFGFTYWFFPIKRDNSSIDDHLANFYGEVDMVYQSDHPFEIRFNPKVLFPIETIDRLKTFRFNNFYLNYFKGIFSSWVGYKIFDWSIVESRSPTDFINQRYLEQNAISPEKFGELAVHLRLSLSKKNKRFIEFVYLPHFTPSLLPEVGNRYDFFAEKRHHIKNLDSRYNYQSSLKKWRPQAVVRFSSTVTDFDYSLFYFNGYERLSGIIFRHGKTDLAFNHEYRTTHLVGLALKKQIGHLIIKAEGVLNQYQNDIQMAERGLGSDNKIIKVPPYFIYAGGVEYMFHKTKDQRDMSVFLEILGDTDSERLPTELDQINPFTSHLFTGYKYSDKASSHRTFSLGIYFDYLEYDIYGNFEYSQRLLKNVRLKGGLSHVYSKSDNSQLKVFHRFTRLAGETILTF